MDMKEETKRAPSVYEQMFPGADELLKSHPSLTSKLQAALEKFQGSELLTRQNEGAKRFLLNFDANYYRLFLLREVLELPGVQTEEIMSESVSNFPELYTGYTRKMKHAMSEGIMPDTQELIDGNI